jgi:hypothetical protein
VSNTIIGVEPKAAAAMSAEEHLTKGPNVITYINRGLDVAYIPIHKCNKIEIINPF